MGLCVGAAVATIKRNAHGVVSGFRECKTAKVGDSLLRRYEVQVRLNKDGSSVYLYPDQLNVLNSQQHLRQSLPQPHLAMQHRLLPPHASKEARTLDSSVVSIAVGFPHAIHEFYFVAFSPSLFIRYKTFPQLWVELALKAVAAQSCNCTGYRVDLLFVQSWIIHSCFFVRQMPLTGAGHSLFSKTMKIVSLLTL